MEDKTQQSLDLVAVEDNLARIRGEVGAGQVDEAYRRVYRRLAHRVRVPGFRPGKAPPPVLERRLGREYIVSEVREELQERIVAQAIQRFGLDPRPGQGLRFDEQAPPEQGKAYEFELTLPVYPQVELPDYREWELEVEPVRVTDELREEFRRSLLEQHKNLVVKEEGEGAEMGDIFVGSLKSEFIDDQAKKDETPPFDYEEIHYKLGVEPELTGFAEKFLGIKPGETREFEYTVPEDYPHDELLRGRRVRVVASCQRILREEVPQFGEEFVTKTLGFGSMEEFESWMERELQGFALRRTREKKLSEIVERLAREAKIDISESWLDEEVQYELADQERRLREQGMTLEKWLEAQEIDPEKYREELRKEVRERLRQYLILREIARREKLEPSSHELSLELYRFISENRLNPREAPKLARNRALISRLRARLTEQKIYDHLLRTVRFKDEAQGEGKETSPHQSGEGEEGEPAQPAVPPPIEQEKEAP